METLLYAIYGRHAVKLAADLLAQYPVTSGVMVGASTVAGWIAAIPASEGQAITYIAGVSIAALMTGVGWMVRYMTVTAVQSHGELREDLKGLREDVAQHNRDLLAIQGDIRDSLKALKQVGEEA